VPVIVHLSDIHFGANLDQGAESLLSDVWERRPDLVVVSGDLTQRARKSQFAAARSFLNRLPVPTLTVMGNHDVPLFDLPRRVLSPTGRYQKFVNSTLDPVIELPGLVAVGLDSMPAWRWKAGHVSRRQAELVRSSLGNSPSGAWRVLVTHHPVLPANLSALHGRGRLIAACGQAGVAILLSGHTHNASVDIVTCGSGGHHVLAVGAGTAISSRTRRTGNAYTVVDLTGPMRLGTTVMVQVRQRDDTGWAAVRNACFRYCDGGINRHC
jgi:3',5'-cyclic AMP phosphodiesterase CpdA